jgi:hypothetical protein
MEMTLRKYAARSPRYGVRWQAQRDTALAFAVPKRLRFEEYLRLQARESAVAAALCRRTP